MQCSRKLLCGLAFIGILIATGHPSFGEPATQQAATPDPVIQMAILLDCSGSMSGLINQARTQLWKTVNEFAKAQRGGRAVKLEVALYEYGSGLYPVSEGCLKQLVPLTDDLDRVSEALFALKTTGSNEYCGQAIEAATHGLQWSENPRDLKCIFIAGNEPFTQGPINFRDACRAAITRDITVNTIHCGNAGEGVSGKWQDGALLADGSFMNINHNQQVAAVPAPQDKELARLSAELNKTYIAYGSAATRTQLIQRQVAQDQNAANSNASAAAYRASFKAQSQYRNSAWDIVDAWREGVIKLEELSEDQLPDELKKMDAKQREAFVREKQDERKKLQATIKDLSAQRDKFLSEARKEQATQQGDTLDEAIIQAARGQAARKKYVFAEQ